MKAKRQLRTTKQNLKLAEQPQTMPQQHKIKP